MADYPGGGDDEEDPIHRPLTRLISAALLLAALTACEASGNGETQDSEPTSAEPDPAVGVYDLTTRITRSTIPQNAAGPQSKESNVVYVTCWDDPCESVAQRASSDTWHAQTFHLVPDGESYTSTRTRTGSCNDGTDKEFRETFTLEWTLGDDGGFRGTAVQEFVGCEDDGVRTADYDVRGAPRSGELPYLDASAAAEVAEVLDVYDKTFASVSEGFVACFEDGVDAVERAECKADVYEPWADGLTELEAALPGLEAGADGACRRALTRTDVAGSGAAVDEAIKANRSVTSPREARRAEGADAAGRETTLAMQTDLVLVATMCVPPSDYNTLGDDGEMLIDAASSLIPPLDG